MLCSGDAGLLGPLPTAIFPAGGARALVLPARRGATLLHVQMDDVFTTSVLMSSSCHLMRLTFPVYDIPGILGGQTQNPMPHLGVIV